MAPAELYVIGDVHGMWDEGDAAFLESHPEATAVFVGDFGDEDVALVERLAAVRTPKAITFGNHDAWNAMRRRGPRERVERQLAVVGDDFIGYRAREIAGGVGLIGGRPFSWGGGWFDGDFYGALFGVRTMSESAERIAEVARSLPAGMPLVLVGHNGPRGLGSEAHSIWGRDFQEPPADWGDGDQEKALERLRAEGRTVVAAVAGHMHERLAFGSGTRQRVVTARGTTFINAAVVPRHRRGLRHFVHITIDGTAVQAADIWVDDNGAIAEQRILTP